MSQHGKNFDSCQRSYDNMEPDWEDSECEICIFFKYGQCVADGEVDSDNDCPSFRDS